MYRQEAPDLNLSDIRRYFDNICITGIPVSPTGSNRTVVMDQECQNREHKPRKEKCQGCNPSKMPYLVVSINLILSKLLRVDPSLIFYNTFVTSCVPMSALCGKKVCSHVFSKVWEI